MNDPPTTPLWAGKSRRWDDTSLRPSPTLIASVAVVVAMAAVVVAIVVATRGHGTNHPTSFPSTNAAHSTPTSDTPTASSPPVAAASVQQVLNEYQTAYSGEDDQGLRELFASNLSREDGTHAPEGLTQALRTYRHQFSQLTDPSYNLSDLSIEPGVHEATASGRYRITSQNGTVGGSITFHLIEQAEHLLIDKLTIEPSK